MRLAWIAAALGCLLFGQPAQADQFFDDFISGRPLATSTLGATDTMPVIQGNQTKRLFPLSYFMRPDGANVTLPDARTNLGASVSGGIWPGVVGGTGVANTGKTITLGGNLVSGGALTTTGAGPTTLAFPGSAATFTFPSATKTLMASDGSNATLPGARTAILPTPTLNDCLVGNGSDWVSGACNPLAVVADNTALAATASTYSAWVLRLDHTTGVGGPATVFKASASACSLNAGAGDGGSQVPTSDSKCWLADLPASGADLRVWGPKPDAGAGVDAGPGIRAAAAWATRVGGTVFVALGDYYLNTLDSSGLGAIVIGTGAEGAVSKPSHFTGASGAGFPDTCGLDTPRFVLGSGLNRPLVLVRMNAGAPHFTDMCLNGNRGAQAGWVGGPGGKLYTIQIEDSIPATVDTSIHLTRAIVSHGYNAALYLGGARGAFFARDSWFVYSGNVVGDYAVWLGGYESFFSNGLFGSNTGSGVLVAAGSQHQFQGGAAFYNSDAGMVVAGGQAQYLSVVGMNFQANQCNGVRITDTAPLAGQNSSGHSFANATFEANSESGAGLCSDILISGRNNEHFLAPLLIGRAHALQNLPKYNIEFSGSASAYVDSPGWGTLGATGANTLGFSNNYTRVFGNLPLEIPWTPTLSGTTGGGAPTHSYNVGTWGRQNQIVTATFALGTTAMNAPTGNMQIGGLPMTSSTTANNFGSCHFSNFYGWTAAAGRTHLAGIIGTTSQVVSLRESGSGVAAQETPIEEFAAASGLIGTCIYPAAAGVPQ